MLEATTEKRRHKSINYYIYRHEKTCSVYNHKSVFSNTGTGAAVKINISANLQKSGLVDFDGDPTLHCETL